MQLKMVNLILYTCKCFFFFFVWFFFNIFTHKILHIKLDPFQCGEYEYSLLQSVACQNKDTDLNYMYIHFHFVMLTVNFKIVMSLMRQ